MKIGIIGAENSHSVAIAKVVNIDKKIPGASVEYIWGETDAAARKTAKAGQIPHKVKKQSEMLGKIDALIVDHRHPKYHIKAALPFVKAGVPTFVDKPFCYRTDEGRELFKIARKNKTPITSFSTLSYQRSFKRFRGKIASMGDVLAGATYGRCDLKSKHGGIFFYGIHQVAMALDAFGDNVSKVLVTRGGAYATGQFLYPGGKIVTLNFINEGRPAFSISAVSTEKSIHQVVPFDASPYLTGIRVFTTMFKTRKEPLAYSAILRPIQVLEALEKSVKSGAIEKVASAYPR